ncbi:MAG: MoxR family ATPase [Pirellulales bacterium]|nr:MoxR family ATPase [Pirellulales bacterium]
MRDQLNTVLLGKEDVVELVLTCLLARGHLLFDDMPGLGKTTLAKALAEAVGGRFARIQCTPDLLPTDVTGFSVYDQKRGDFEFRPGPVFCDVLLADEINRATPRTQSALFEAMAERQVSIDGSTHQLSNTFFVVATQNPVESHGAFPLPEAQLDRFAMKLSIGYPDRGSELQMLQGHVGVVSQSHEVSSIGLKTVGALQELAANVHVCPSVQEYLIDLGRATREHAQIEIGLSPRGILIWQRVAQAHALLSDRDFVIPDDVQHVATPVLSVRLSGDFDNTEEVIGEVLSSIPVPTKRKSGGSAHV